MKSPTVLSECDKDALRTWAGHRCKYTTGILERGCGREADKARGVAFETTSDWTSTVSLSPGINQLFLLQLLDTMSLAVWTTAPVLTL